MRFIREPEIIAKNATFTLLFMQSKQSLRMKKNYLLIFLLFGYCQLVKAQCEPMPIAGDQLLLIANETPEHPIANLVDGDSTTFWRAGNGAFPHNIELDLGEEYIVEQMSVLPRQDNANGKLASYEIYASLEADFITPEKIGTLVYESYQDSTAKSIIFGAIKTRFMRIVATSNFDPSNQNRLMIAELVIYESPCAEIGRLNQTLRFDPIEKQLTTNAPFEAQVLTSSGLTPKLEVVAGPATIEEEKITFTGEEGEVTIRAYQEGNEEYYPTEGFHTFTVIDPSLYAPTLATRLTTNYPLEMPELMPYLLTANSNIEHTDVLAVEKVAFEIEGDTYLGEAIKNSYQVWWQPSSYGEHLITITSYASNGVTTSETRTIYVETPNNVDKSVQPLDKDLILFGGQNSRWLYKTVSFPQFVGAYEQIIGDFWTTCPDVAGDCDDWDRKAWIDVKGPDGNWIEIIRYITPYGRGCEHQIDLTDYASILQGDVEMRMFIDTWGTGGWDVHLRLNYKAGTPMHNYSYIEPLWDGTFDFGNPVKLQPLDTVLYELPADAQSAKLKVATTGHGWGSNNHQNAAEFYDATHFFNINGTRTFTQHLWVQCDPNPDGCQPQSGTYRFPRAGWCPGALAELYEYNFTPYIGAGALELSYIFDPRYSDICHPNNPSCITGVTCGDCNAGFNPHYEVAANLVIFGNAPVLSSTKAVAAETMGLSLFPNPTKDYFTIKIGAQATQIQVQLQALDGRTLQTHQFAQAAELKTAHFDIKALPAGMYLVQVLAEGTTASLKLVKE